MSLMLSKRPVLVIVLMISVFITAILLSQSDFIPVHPDKQDLSANMITSTAGEISSGKREYEYLRLRNPETGLIPEGIARKQLEFAHKLPTIESVRQQRLIKGEKVNEYGWKSRGPFYKGGRTRGVDIDIRNENIIITGGVSGGIWKSTDGGQSWNKKTKPYQLHSTSYILQDKRPGKEDIWYCSTGEGRGGGIYGGDGIFKSVDNGETWSLLASTSTNKPHMMGAPFTWIWGLAIDNSNQEEDEIYAAAQGAIYRSVDGGISWTRVLYNNGYDTEVEVTSEGIVYATLSGGDEWYDQGLFRSEDGINWTEITPDTWPSSFYRIKVAVAPSNENVVYFFAETTEDPNDWQFDSTHILLKYTYKSGNGAGSGGTWENFSENIPEEIYTIHGYCQLLEVYPEDENILFLGGQNLYRSTDAFETNNDIAKLGDVYWTFDRPYGIHCDHHRIIFLKNDPKVAYAVNDGGISKTEDILAEYIPWSTSVDWEYLNNGYLTTQVVTSSIPPGAGDPRIMACMWDNGVYITQNGNQENMWNFMMGGDGAYSAFADKGSKYIISWQEGNTYISDRIPAGATTGGFWTRINPRFSSETIFINPFTVDPNNDKVVYMGGGRNLLRCDDVTWIPADYSDALKSGYWTEVASVAPGKVSAIGVSKEPGNVLYVGTYYGQVYRIDNALGSTPEKTNIYSNKGFPYYGYVSSIAVDPHDADHVLVTFSNYYVKSIFSTMDGGEKWEHVSGNLEQFPETGLGAGPSVNWIAILPENGANTYFAGTTTGLYSTRKLDGEETIWAQEGQETIGNIDVRHVVTREIDGEVVVGTYGNGLYSRDFTTAVEEDKAQRPDDFELMQNYPNPFNPETTIDFYIRKTADVRLSIYSISGQLIKTLVSEKLPSGYHSYKWRGLNESGKKVSTGIYIYRLNTSDQISTKKMLMIK